jgi:hypothetical protein
VRLPNRVVRGEKGAALVASRDIAPGDVVARFAGDIVPRAAIPEAEMPYALWLEGDRWMIPRTEARWINHGCDPNCTVEDDPRDPDSFDVVARRPIAAGEEITFSYNRITAEEWVAHEDDPAYRFWHPSWSFTCLCAAKECQGRIEGYRIVGDVAAARAKKTS